MNTVLFYPKNLLVILKNDLKDTINDKNPKELKKISIAEKLVEERQNADTKDKTHGRRSKSL